MKTSIFIFLSLMRLIAQESVPLWVSDPKSIYPDDRYLSAVGTGDTRRAAEMTAAAGLSMIFESAITAEQSVIERFNESFQNDASTMDHSSNVTKNISVNSQQELYNIQYGQSWTDKSGRVYVAAYLERGKTAEIYTKKIDENGKKVMAYLSLFSKANDPVDRYVYINACSVISQMNESLRKQLLIISSPDYSNLVLPYKQDDVINKCIGAKKNIVFDIILDGDSKNTLLSVIRETISGLGFEIGNDQLFTLKGTILLEEVVLQRPERFVRWSYTISLVNRVNTILTSFTDNGREGHVTIEEAKARAYKTMRAKIKSNLENDLTRYFNAKINK